MVPSIIDYYYYYFLINLSVLFIYFWLCWVFVAVHGLSLVVARGGHSSLWSTGSRCAGSVVVARGLSSCG